MSLPSGSSGKPDNPASSDRCYRGDAVSPRPPIGGCRPRAGWGSAEERAGIAGEKLDEVVLSAAAVFSNSRPSGSSGGLADPERLRRLWHAADLDDGQQHAQLHRRQPLMAGNCLQRRAGIERGRVH